MINIEDDVWIGVNVLILSTCCRIGRGILIGAFWVIIMSPYTVVRENLAKEIKMRFDDDTIKRLKSFDCGILQKNRH